jgi:hypothetical protein
MAKMTDREDVTNLFMGIFHEIGARARFQYKDTALKNKKKVKFFSEIYFCHICKRQAGPLFRAR